ncbi:MAG: MFS transporter [Clostridia bacterium]|nr:MFS transporter [Clostridia bacterium]
MVQNIFSNIGRKLHYSFSALDHRDFRYFWFGQCFSLTGTWVQNVSQAWLVYKLTQSPFLLGLAGAMQFTPMLLFSLFAGVLIDRFSKKKMIIGTQIIYMTLALLLAFLIWMDWIRYWQVLVIAGISGFVNTIDMPARQSFMIELVGKKDLLNAIALNSAVFNAARIIGPALAGLLMGYSGIGFCFFINGISFIPVLLGLGMISSRSYGKKEGLKKNIFKEISEGIQYICQFKLLLSTLLTVAVMGIFAVNFSVLVPVFVKTVLNQGETGFGLLMSFMGIGCLSGALIIAAKSGKGKSGFTIWQTSMITAVLLIILGATSTFYFTAVVIAVAGLFITSFFTTANSTMQLNASDAYRGRVTSFYTLLFAGTSPIGNLFAGSIADKFGARVGFIASGAVILLFIPLIYLLSHKKN